MNQETLHDNTNATELLQFLAESGKIDLDDAANEMRKSNIQKIVDQHPYKISQTGKDKRWRTYIKDENGERKLIAKSSLEELHFHILPLLRKK